MGSTSVTLVLLSRFHPYLSLLMIPDLTQIQMKGRLVLNYIKPSLVGALPSNPIDYGARAVGKKEDRIRWADAFMDVDTDLGLGGPTAYAV